MGTDFDAIDGTTVPRVTGPFDTYASSDGIYRNGLVYVNRSVIVDPIDLDALHAQARPDGTAREKLRRIRVRVKSIEDEIDDEDDRYVERDNGRIELPEGGWHVNARLHLDSVSVRAHVQPSWPWESSSIEMDRNFSTNSIAETVGVDEDSVTDAIEHAIGEVIHVANERIDDKRSSEDTLDRTVDEVESILGDSSTIDLGELPSIEDLEGIA